EPISCRARLRNQWHRAKRQDGSARRDGYGFEYADGEEVRSSNEPRRKVRSVRDAARALCGAHRVFGLFAFHARVGVESRESLGKSGCRADAGIAAAAVEQRECGIRRSRTRLSEPGGRQRTFLLGKRRCRFQLWW